MHVAHFLADLDVHIRPIGAWPRGSVRQVPSVFVFGIVGCHLEPDEPGQLRAAFRLKTKGAMGG